MRGRIKLCRGDSAARPVVLTANLMPTDFQAIPIYGRAVAPRQRHSSRLDYTSDNKFAVVEIWGRGASTDLPIVKGT